MRQMEFRRVRRRWPGVTSQLLYMTCRAFMRRNADLPGFRYTSSCHAARIPDYDRHPEVPERSEGLEGRRPVKPPQATGRSSFEARLRSHLRMTVVEWWALSGDRLAFFRSSLFSSSHHLRFLPSSHHLSFPRGVRRADHLVSLCRPRTRGAAERRKAHTGSSITLARRDAALTARGDPGATGIAPLGAPPWRFPAAGPRFNSGSVHRIHVATCPPARSQDLADWVPYLPRRGSLPSATGRHASLRL